MAKGSQLAAWSAELERMARGLSRVGPEEVCCEGLTPRQCSILRTLVDKQGTRLSDLAGEAGITPSAMTRALEKLEAQALIKRVRGADQDGRAATVAITGRGREVRTAIDRLMRERTKTILSHIPAGFRPQLLAGLRMLNQTMEPGGCCEFTGEWPDVALSCRIGGKGKPAARGKRNSRPRP